MTQVLHVQTRAYPFNHVGTTPPRRPLRVDGDPLPLEGRPLKSLVYRQPESTLVAKVTTPITRAIGDFAATAAPGDDASKAIKAVTDAYGGMPTVQWAVLRVLSAGAVLLSTALRHDADLAGHDAGTLARHDAVLDRALRAADRSVMARILTALIEAEVLTSPRPQLAHAEDPDSTLPDERAVRYNCHFVADQLPWAPDTRGHAEAFPTGDGARCSLLLPYTYAWELSPDTSSRQILGTLEPTDLALCEVSTLRGASVWAVDMLEELSRRPAEPHHFFSAAPQVTFPVHRVRRHLDRVRSTYHRLNAYRYNSAQESRAIFLTARETMGLEEHYARTETMLAEVGDSLEAAAKERASVLDRKLNRVAAVLAVATAGVFVFDLVAFARAEIPPPPLWRMTTVIAVVLAGVTAVAYLFLSTRQRD